MKTGSEKRQVVFLILVWGMKNQVCDERFWQLPLPSRKTVRDGARSRIFFAVSVGREREGTLTAQGKACPFLSSTHLLGEVLRRVREGGAKAED